MADIPITGVASDYRVPGSFVEISFAQGPSSGALPGREIVVVMPKGSAGTAVAGELYEIKKESDAITLCDSGSPAHRALRIGLQSNKTARWYYLGQDATSGGAPVAATGIVTLATAATGTGVLSVTICGEECTAGITNGDSITVIGDAIEASINAKTWLPVTASNAAGTVTLTAKISGVSQGDGTIPVIRYRTSITPGIGTTSTAAGVAVGIGGASVAGVDGSTTEVATLTTALASLDAVRKYYIVTSTNSTTGLAALATHISNKSEPRPGLRSVGVSAFNGTLAAGTTLAVARNYERLWVAWMPSPDNDPPELAGNLAAVLQKRQNVESQYNFDGYNGTDWLIKPIPEVANWPDDDDLNDAINGGLTPIASTATASSIVSLITTRSKTAAGGTIADYRASEGHRVSVADEFADEMQSYYALNYGSKQLKPDVLLADGTVDTNASLPENVVTPNDFRAWIGKQFDDYEAIGKVQDAAGSIESLELGIDPQNSGRLESGMDLHVIDQLHQFTAAVSEVSTG